MSAPLTLQVRLGFSMGWRIWSPNEVRFYAKSLAHSIFILKILRNKLLLEKIWIVDYSIFMLPFRYIVFLDYLRFGQKHKEEKCRWHNIAFVSLLKRKSWSSRKTTAFVKLRYIARHRTFRLKRGAGSILKAMRFKYLGKRKRIKKRIYGMVGKRRPVAVKRKKKVKFIRQKHRHKGIVLYNLGRLCYMLVKHQQDSKQKSKRVKNNKARLALKNHSSALRMVKRALFFTTLLKASKIKNKRKNLLLLKNNPYSVKQNFYKYIRNVYVKRQFPVRNKKLFSFYGGPYIKTFRRLLRANTAKRVKTLTGSVWAWQKLSLALSYYSSMSHKQYWKFY